MNANQNCCYKTKSKERDPKQIKLIDARINRITGQLSGVKKMIEENRYCADVLIQLSAISKAVNSLASVIMEEHLNTCVVDKIRQGETAVVQEVVELFKKFN